MKRRLSVAIALLGGPRIVYLDEPTTGMRFGSGYTLAVSVTAAASGHSAYPASQYGLYGANGEPSTPAVIERRVAGVKRFSAERLGLGAPAWGAGGGLEESKARSSTNHSVFLNIARAAEVVAPASSGSTEVTHVLDDGSRLKIPVGAELVGHPATGAAYRVCWGTDEAGPTHHIMDCTELPPGSMEAAGLAAANGGGGGSGAQPAMGVPPTGPGAYVPPLPVAPPVPAPSPSLAAGHFPGHPPTFPCT
ncbi:hypothetical protein HYH02_008168 [Chlamydomonas schloesseri]|uniref:ABC transporter A family member 2/9/11 C-terminal domain-containing protein n=1 Tax=Chlamydomonas schloesseri TaxID=2026947 RepID=A0A835WHC7_9CHLO|nr:hypothetical protein HYH02_008168 [Chlamydomonas schloesseri]|eukprot:KAG2447015.1 hypothetical protein HYH02_008168 [Chlamydomonas schloesseri]